MSKFTFPHFIVYVDGPYRHVERRTDVSWDFDACFDRYEPQGTLTSDKVEARMTDATAGHNRYAYAAVIGRLKEELREEIAFLIADDRNDWQSAKTLRAGIWSTETEKKFRKPPTAAGQKKLAMELAAELTVWATRHAERKDEIAEAFTLYVDNACESFNRWYREGATRWVVERGDERDDLAAQWADDHGDAALALELANVRNLRRQYDAAQKAWRDASAALGKRVVRTLVRIVAEKVTDGNMPPAVFAACLKEAERIDPTAQTDELSVLDALTDVAFGGP